MQATMSGEKLTGAVKIASQFLGRKHVLPVLNNVMLSASGAGLTVAATNLEVMGVFHVSAEVATEGAICILPGEVQKFKGEVALATDDKAIRLTLTGKGGNATLYGLSADEYPACAAIGGASAFTIDRLTLVTMLQITGVAIAEEDNRPILTGVHLTASAASGEVVFESADGRRLHQASVTYNALDRDIDCVFPSVKALLAALAYWKDARLIAVSVTDDAIGFAPVGSAEFVKIQLIEGRFPNVKQIMLAPGVGESARFITAESAAIKATKHFGKEVSWTSHLISDGAHITVRSTCADKGEKHTPLTASWDRATDAPTGDFIALNHTYLTDALEALGRVGADCIARFQFPTPKDGAGPVWRSRSALQLESLDTPIKVRVVIMPMNIEDSEVLNAEALPTVPFVRPAPSTALAA